MNWPEAASRMKQSLGDVWASTYLGKITPEKQALAEKLEFAVNVIETMEDMVEEEHYGPDQD
jgi:hypothetical protein